jgi:hypothetical protein
MRLASDRFMVKPDQQRFHQLSRNLFNRNLRDRWNQSAPLNLSPCTRLEWVLERRCAVGRCRWHAGSVDLAVSLL